MTPGEETCGGVMSPGEFPKTTVAECSNDRHPKELNLRDEHITLNGNQQQRLLATCKHIDKLLEAIEATLNAAASKSVFPEYTSDITPDERKTIEDRVAGIREQLLKVLAGQSLAPEPPRISASHSISVNLTFIDVAIAELAPRYMRGYGPVSEEGAADLDRIVDGLQASGNELMRYVRNLGANEQPSRRRRAQKSS
jgi:hypothetical protein